MAVAQLWGMNLGAVPLWRWYDQPHCKRVRPASPTPNKRPHSLAAEYQIAHTAVMHSSSPVRSWMPTNSVCCWHLLICIREALESFLCVTHCIKHPTVSNNIPIYLNELKLIGNSCIIYDFVHRERKLFFFCWVCSFALISNHNYHLMNKHHNISNCI